MDTKADKICSITSNQGWRRPLINLRWVEGGRPPLSLRQSCFSLPSASEMTYTVSGGALISTQSINQPLADSPRGDLGRTWSGASKHFDAIYTADIQPYKIHIDV